MQEEEEGREEREWRGEGRGEGGSGSGGHLWRVTGNKFIFLESGKQGNGISPLSSISCTNSINEEPNTGWREVSPYRLFQLLKWNEKFEKSLFCNLQWINGSINRHWAASN